MLLKAMIVCLDTEKPCKVSSSEFYSAGPI